MDRFHPDRWFSPTPGTAGTIHNRRSIRHWYTTFAAENNRINLESIGISTEGNPIDALFIADDMSDLALEQRRQARQHEVDRLLYGKRDQSSADTDRKAVVLITAGIHATEIGGPQSIPTLVHWLVSSEEPAAHAIRENVLVIVVPTLNPDGQDLVDAWHAATRDSPVAGTVPPLLYHRFAGHDNNRDWIFRNLAETRVVMDRLHASWMPHVTLDQHQMSRFGPRFALPPFSDPWNPWVPAEIIAGSAMLGQAIASDMTSAGLAGIQTSKYFDAWEPSRAIQHFRGGIRVLAEAASANLADSVSVSEDQLRNPPMTQSQQPSMGQPRPWQGGTWTLTDIMHYHLAAARSLLRHVADSPDRFVTIQQRALTPASASKVSYRLDPDTDVPDAGAQRRIGKILADAGLCSPDKPGRVDGTNALARLADALLRPTNFPEERGTTSYDITSHYLPLMTGAVVQAVAGADPVSPPSAPNRNQDEGNLLLIDARSHQAPRIIEQALRENRLVRRALRVQLVNETMVPPGSWIVDCTPEDVDRSGATVSARRIATLPSATPPVLRRDLVLASISDEPSADHGWTRLWFHQQGIPFLETHHLHRIDPWPESRLLFLPDCPNKALPDSLLGILDRWLRDGGDILAVGKTARMLVPALVDEISAIDGDAEPEIIAPGAIVALRPHMAHLATLGLDRTIPAIHAHDGAFSYLADADDRAIATFARQNTVLSGWMGGDGHIAGKAAIIEHSIGKGRLWGFSFRPLFRAQALVTSPLVHNLMYQPGEGKVLE